MVHNPWLLKELCGEFFIIEQNLTHNQFQNRERRNSLSSRPRGWGNAAEETRDRTCVNRPPSAPPPAPLHTPSLPDKRAELSHSGHFTHRFGIGRKVLLFYLLFSRVKSLQIERLIETGCLCFSLKSFFAFLSVCESVLWLLKAQCLCPFLQGNFVKTRSFWSCNPTVKRKESKKPLHLHPTMCSSIKRVWTTELAPSLDHRWPLRLLPLPWGLPEAVGIWHYCWRPLAWWVPEKGTVKGDAGEARGGGSFTAYSTASAATPSSCRRWRAVERSRWAGPTWFSGTPRRRMVSGPFRSCSIWSRPWRTTRSGCRRWEWDTGDWRHYILHFLKPAIFQSAVMLPSSHVRNYIYELYLHVYLILSFPSLRNVYSQKQSVFILIRFKLLMLTVQFNFYTI